MKTQKISKYMFCLLLIIASISCKKSLDLQPHDQIAETDFWKTETDAKLALTGCYSTLLQSYFSMDYQPCWDNLSDDAWDYNNNVGAKTSFTAPLNSTTSGMVTQFYTDTYKRIAVCNYFLDNVDKVKTTPAEISAWKAEVLFLRSFYYYYLTEFYGNVPMILHAYALNSPLIQQSTKDAVVAQILADLATAIQNLPDATYTDGHAVKATALLLQAKILLANQKYAEAAAAAQQVISSGKFQLYGNYQNIFLKAGQNADDTEILFSVRYISPNLETISGLRYGWWMSINPFKNLVDEYECTDGKSITQSPLYDPANPYANRDARLNQSIMVPGSSYGFDLEGAPDWNDRIPILPKPLMYGSRKYLEPSVRSVDLAQHCENDVVLLRYADALLTYAEAKNEASGPDASVFTAINQVRARSSMPAISTSLSQSDLRDKIRHERRIELVFEGQRWLDLKRWKLADARINSINLTQSPIAYIFQPNNYLWPFPQSEVDYYKAHGSKLVQNPGYN